MADSDSPPACPRDRVHAANPPPVMIGGRSVKASDSDPLAPAGCPLYYYHSRTASALYKGTSRFQHVCPIVQIDSTASLEALFNLKSNW